MAAHFVLPGGLYRPGTIFSSPIHRSVRCRDAVSPEEQHRVTETPHGLVYSEIGYFIVLQAIPTDQSCLVLPIVYMDDWKDPSEHVSLRDWNDPGPMPAEGPYGWLSCKRFLAMSQMHLKHLILSVRGRNSIHLGRHQNHLFNTPASIRGYMERPEYERLVKLYMYVQQQKLAKLVAEYTHMCYGDCGLEFMA